MIHILVSCNYFRHFFLTLFWSQILLHPVLRVQNSITKIRKRRVAKEELQDRKENLARLPALSSGWRSRIDCEIYRSLSGNNWWKGWRAREVLADPILRRAAPRCVDRLCDLVNLSVYNASRRVLFCTFSTTIEPADNQNLRKTIRRRKFRTRAQVGIEYPGFICFRLKDLWLFWISEYTAWHTKLWNYLLETTT